MPAFCQGELRAEFFCSLIFRTKENFFDLASKKSQKVFFEKNFKKNSKKCEKNIDTKKE